MTESPTKTELRARIGVALRSMDITAAMQAAVLMRLREFIRGRGSSALVAYMPIGREVDVRAILSETLAVGRALALPRYNRATGGYELVAVRRLDQELVTGRYGIAEPAPGLQALKELPDDAIWLVPGVGFEPGRGVRLGRGGGFYDRLLDRYPWGCRVGVAWELQLQPQLPAEEHDKSMDAVVTEAAIYLCQHQEAGLKIGTHSDGQSSGVAGIPV